MSMVYNQDLRDWQWFAVDRYDLSTRGRCWSPESFKIGSAAGGTPARATTPDFAAGAARQRHSRPNPGAAVGLSMSDALEIEYPTKHKENV